VTSDKEGFPLDGTETVLKDFTQVSQSEPRSGIKSWPSSTFVIATLIAEFLFLPIFIWGAVQAWQHSGSRIEDWLPENFPETKLLSEFKQKFGSDEMLIVGWPEAVLGSADIDAVQQRLLAEGGELEPFFEEVFTGNSVLSSLTGAPSNLSVRQAKVAMRGWILGEEDQTFIVARVSALGTHHRREAVDLVRKITGDVTGCDSSDIHVAGATADVVAIDEASKNSLLTLNVLSAFVCITLLAMGSRSLLMGMTIFGIAALWEMGAMALIHFTGGRMDNVLLLTANLCGVLSMSASIHTCGYYREALVSYRDWAPAKFAFMTSLAPTLLAALTTAIGFGSLMVSQIGPVWNFGFYSMIAAPIAVVLTLWLLTITFRLGFYQPKRAQLKPSHLSFASQSSEEVGPDIPSPRRLTGQQQSRQTWLVLAATAAVLLSFGIGLSRLDTAVGMHDLLPKNNRLLADYEWLEQHVGALVPIEVALRVKSSGEASVLGELNFVRQVQIALSQVDNVESTISALNFCTPIPTNESVRGIRGVVRRVVFEQQLSKGLSDFQAMHMLYCSDDSRTWRITARVHGGIKQDYEAILQDIQSTASQAIDSKDALDADVTVSGIVPLTVKTQDRLILDMAASFGSAILLIGLTIAIVFRSLAAGMIVMIPNVLPAVVVFGMMGWLNIPCEIAGVMTAGAVLGIVVDDSVHLILMMRSLVQQGFDRHRAIDQALSVCRPAMIQTSVVCGLGMLVFALSPFTPIQRFAWIMAALLAVALVGDLFVLPALVRSRLGKFLAGPSRSIEGSLNAESH
jgi:predicted RND superfamily exporter protein